MLGDRTGANVEGKARKAKDRGSQEGYRTMTLADFLKIFDFDSAKLEIYTSFASKLLYVGTYENKTEVERDFCTRLYQVIEISLVDESILQVNIRH